MYFGKHERSGVISEIIYSTANVERNMIYGVHLSSYYDDIESMKPLIYAYYIFHSECGQLCYDVLQYGRKVINVALRNSFEDGDVLEFRIMLMIEELLTLSPFDPVKMVIFEFDNVYAAMGLTEEEFDFVLKYTNRIRHQLQYIYAVTEKDSTSA